MAARLGLFSAMEHAARFVLNRQGFVSRTVETDVGSVHVYDADGRGSLPPMVVLHGLGSAASAFGPLLARLRPHARRVVAPELPGHGFSDPPSSQLNPETFFVAVRDVLDELVDEPVILIGSSLGGALALRYAIERPDRLAALALVSPAGARLSVEEWADLIGTFKIESTAEARLLLERLYHRPPWYLRALAPGFREVMQRPAIRDILEAASPEHLPAPDSLLALAMPILVLWGQSERLLPPSSLDYFRRHLPGHAVIEEPEGFGHCPHFEAPARLAARMIEFAAQAVSTTHS
jgi:pimeloyl-ACP methyl ester carboxylesterase